MDDCLSKDYFLILAKYLRSLLLKLRQEIIEYKRLKEVLCVGVPRFFVWAVISPRQGEIENNHRDLRGTKIGQQKFTFKKNLTRVRGWVAPKNSKKRGECRVQGWVLNCFVMVISTRVYFFLIRWVVSTQVNTCTHTHQVMAFKYKYF